MGLDRVTARVEAAEQWCHGLLFLDRLCRRGVPNKGLSRADRNALVVLAGARVLALQPGNVWIADALVKPWKALRKALTAHVEGERKDAWVAMPDHADRRSVTGQIVRALSLLGLVDRSGEDVRIRWKGVVSS